MPTETYASAFEYFVFGWGCGLTFHVFLHFLGVILSTRHAEEFMK